MIEEIIIRPNLKKKNINYIKGSNLPVIMYGAGSYANDMVRFLKNQGVNIVSHCDDDIYTKVSEDKNVNSIEKISGRYKQFLIIIGFADYKKAAANLNTLGIKQKTYFFDSPDYLEFFDYGYIQQHKNAFEESYKLFSDKKSRKIFTSFINSKISGDPSYLYDYVNLDQYFSDPVVLNDHEVFVDCGAYDGDTIKKFLSHVEQFDEIIAYEPEKNNYSKILKGLEAGDKKKIRLIKRGCWSSNTSLSFDRNHNMSSFLTNGSGTQVEVDTIDASVNSEPTYIKMDIEGAELEALKGAVNTITKYRPKIAVSVYHKPDDLLSIPQFVNKICKNYKFYLRQHQYITWETVLYAIPN